MPYFRIPWYFSLIYGTATGLCRHYRRYSRATFGWRVGDELTEKCMEQFAVGIESGDMARAEQDLRRIADLLSTTIVYALCGNAFNRILETARELVAAGEAGEVIVVRSRETWADHWILSLPAVIFQAAYESGTALRIDGVENLLGTLAGWFTANTAPQARRHLYEGARRATDRPQELIFKDTMVELAIQINELQEDALDGRILRRSTATSLKKFSGAHSREQTGEETWNLLSLSLGEVDHSLSDAEDRHAMDELAGQLLAPREREVYQVYDLPDRQIARMLGMAVGTVASNKHRIRQKFAAFSPDFC